jgi:hypothetical protein
VRLGIIPYSINLVGATGCFFGGEGYRPIYAKLANLWIVHASREKGAKSNAENDLREFLFHK